MEISPNETWTYDRGLDRRGAAEGSGRGADPALKKKGSSPSLLDEEVVWV